MNPPEVPEAKAPQLNAERILEVALSHGDHEPGITTPTPHNPTGAKLAAEGTPNWPILFAYAGLKEIGAQYPHASGPVGTIVDANIRDLVIERFNENAALRATIESQTARVQELEGERDEAIKAHGFVWNAARKAAQYFRWAGCRDTIAIEAMNVCCEAEKLPPKWSTDWTIISKIELANQSAALLAANKEVEEAKRKLDDLKGVVVERMAAQFNLEQQGENVKLRARIAELEAAPPTPAAQEDEAIQNGEMPAWTLTLIEKALTVAPIAVKGIGKITAQNMRAFLEAFTLQLIATLTKPSEASEDGKREALADALVALKSCCDNGGTPNAGYDDSMSFDADLVNAAKAKVSAALADIAARSATGREDVTVPRGTTKETLTPPAAGS